jgi:putative DNA primase/helicase
MQEANQTMTTGAAGIQTAKCSCCPNDHVSVFEGNDGSRICAECYQIMAKYNRLPPEKGKSKPNGKAKIDSRPRYKCTEPGCETMILFKDSVCPDHTLSAKTNRELDAKDAKRKEEESKAAAPKKGEFLFHTTDSDDTVGEKVSIVGIRMSDIVTEKLEWLWQDRIPSGNITLFGGQPGCGKSVVLLDIIARTTAGREWPDGKQNTLGSRHVLLLASEDGEADTIKPRLIAAGADMTKIVMVRRIMIQNPATNDKRKRQLQLAADIKRLKTALKEHPEVALVALDPISAFFGDVDPNKDKQIRPVMEGIADAMEGAKCAFIGIIHNNKRGDADSISKILGGSSVVGVARSVWGFSFDADDKELRHMLLVKGNLSEKRSGVSYKLVDTPVKLDGGEDDHQPLCVWQGETDDDADDMLAKKRDRAKNPPQDSLSDKAEKLVHEQLETGPKTAVFMYELGKKNGIKGKTLKRAHVAVGGLCTKSKPYTWYLPDVSDNPDADVQPWRQSLKMVPEAKLQDTEAL